jgi:predicted TIM-barrel fold metal-dependent hydrolase
MDVTAPSLTAELYEHITALDEAAREKVLGRNARELYGM